MTTTHTHTPYYSTSFGTYNCSTCVEEITYEEALEINPEIN